MGSDIIIESKIRRRKLMLRNSYLCDFSMKKYRDCPLNATELIPSAKVRCGPPRYCPLRLDLWQLLYHQAPLKFNAQEPSIQRSLS